MTRPRGMQFMVPGRCNDGLYAPHVPRVDEGGSCCVIGFIWTASGLNKEAGTEVHCPIMRPPRQAAQLRQTVRPNESRKTDRSQDSTTVVRRVNNACQRRRIY
jgi:hypothetical protein